MTIFARTAVLILLVLLSGCKKDPSLPGTTVQPAPDLLTGEYLESNAVYGHSLPHDTVYSFNDRNKFLGSNKDPVFGQIDAGLYLNANTSLSNISFGAQAVFTSAEIVLAVDGLNYAGDKNAVLSFSIFPLDSALQHDRNYLASNNKLHSGTPLPTIYKGTLTTMSGKSVLRIAFDSVYAKTIFNDTAHLVSNEAFQKQYKGFYIAASVDGAGEGAIFKCDLEDALSGLWLNYKESASADSIRSFQFSFSGTSAARFNTVSYNHTFANSTLKSQLSGDTTAGSKNLFLKGLGVLQARISIPLLKNISDSVKLAVNRAELVFPVDESFVFSGMHPLPPALVLMAISATGSEELVRDQLTTIDNGRYNGKYDAERKAYVFNIARHAQAIFNGEAGNHGFLLMVADPDRLDLINRNKILKRIVRKDIFTEGVILHGSGSSSGPVLKLSYTRLTD